jgi:hypothetical protein
MREIFRKILSFGTILMLVFVMFVGMTTNVGIGENEEIHPDDLCYDPMTGRSGWNIEIISPNGGEIIIAGMTIVIEWVATGGYGGYVKFYYSTDGGEDYPNFIDCVSNPSIIGANPKYSWIVPPNINSSIMRIKADWVSSPEGIPIYYDGDVTDDNFTVRQDVAVHFRSVPETASYGRYYTITWNLWDPFGSAECVDLQLSIKLNETSGWGDWEGLGGIYDRISYTKGGVWWSPPNYASASARLKVRALTNFTEGIVAKEDICEEFQIVSPIILLLKPNGGETLIGKQTYNIEWRTVNDPEEVIIGIKIEYSTDGGETYNEIASSTTNDFVYEWAVPLGIDSEQVKVKVTAQYGEWIPLATDESNRYNTIISNPKTVTVSLDDPNPIVDGGIILRGGEDHTIKWSKTGNVGDINRFELHTSTNGGETFSKFATASASLLSYNWLVPEIDNERCRILVKCILRDSTKKEAMSNCNFTIFTTIAFNTPPVAIVEPRYQEVDEGSVVTLDGDSSYDSNGDAITYNWSQVDSTGFTVTLENETTSTPTFIPNINQYPVILIFELRVSDGIDISPLDPLYPNTIFRTEVQVNPTGPNLIGFQPRNGWEGSPVSITGTNLKGGEIYINGVYTGTVPTWPSPTFPDPDTSYNFTIGSDVPHGRGSITVRTSAGEFSTTDQIEIFPVPEYSLNWGFQFTNPSQSSLSYPWLVWEDGRYHDTFGDDVFISIWVCIGVPYWSPWSGVGCLGYELEQPVAPDPLAIAFYTAAYWWLPRNGECFGMSINSLQFYHGELDPANFAPSGSTEVNQLNQTGALDRRIDYLHGSQVSAELLAWYIGSAIVSTTISPLEQIIAMNAFLEGVEAAVDTGLSGVISFIYWGQGHAVVPYLVEDVDEDHTRIYVYDSNREWFSNETTAIDALMNNNDADNYPPYIEIDKSGIFWTWSFEMAGGDDWGGPFLIFFAPYSLVNGRRTLPTSIWDGMLNFIVGSATSQIEDEDGRSLGFNESGNLVTEIPNAIPIPGGQEIKGFAMPYGNYTTTIRGQGPGTYNWSTFCKNLTSFSIQDAGVASDTEDTVTLNYEEGNPLAGSMSYRTSDASKGYSSTIIKKFGQRQRVYSIKNATIFDDSEAILKTSEDFGSLVFTNNGPHEFTYDVEFQTNVVSQEVADRGPITSLPRAYRSSIVIEPYETHILTPDNWLDLDSSSIEIEEEGGEQEEDEFTGLYICLKEEKISLKVKDRRKKSVEND